MDDRTLLERAAGAAGLAAFWDELSSAMRVTTVAGHWYLWRPLTDDGDALRLSSALCMNVKHDDPNAVVCGWSNIQRVPITHDGNGPWHWKEWLRDHGNNRTFATRRAIVRAAAALADAPEGKA